VKSSAKADQVFNRLATGGQMWNVSKESFESAYEENSRQDGS